MKTQPDGRELKASAILKRMDVPKRYAAWPEHAHDAADEP
jgi:hypothetical protein